MLQASDLEERTFGATEYAVVFVRSDGVSMYASCTVHHVLRMTSNSQAQPLLRAEQ